MVTDTTKLIFQDESYHIRGAVYEVYNQIGCGFFEGVYQECLLREFNIRNIPCISQPDIQISYKGSLLGLVFRPDFVCYDKIILEIKAVGKLVGDHRAQILNYLKASGFSLGFLVNFGSSPRALIERFVR